MISGLSKTLQRRRRTAEPSDAVAEAQLEHAQVPYSTLLHAPDRVNGHANGATAVNGAGESNGTHVNGTGAELLHAPESPEAATTELATLVATVPETPEAPLRALVPETADPAPQTADPAPETAVPAPESAVAAPQTLAPGGDADAQPAPATEPQRPLDLRTRSQLRRRARYLRRLREVQLRDIGGLAVELHRFGRRRDDLVARKVTAAAETLSELRALEEALHEQRTLAELRIAGIGGACVHCGAVHGSSDRFCSSCGRPLAEAPGAEPSPSAS